VWRVPTASAPSWQQHAQALALALLCSVLFLRDALLPGRALVPFPPEVFDVHMAEAKAKGRFDFEDTFRGHVGMADKYLQSLCWDRVMHDRFARGEMPRWTNDIGGGAPFVPQMAQPFEPINALLLLLPSVQWYGWWFLLHQVLFGWLAYTFFRRIGCLHASALLGLVAAGLGLWTQCKIHHNVILTAALPLWPMLSAVHDALTATWIDRRAAARTIGKLAIWTGISWSSGFVVVSLQATYLVIAFAALLAMRAPRGERLRRLVPIGLGLGLGGMVSLANMLPVLMASAVSARAGTFDPARLQALGLEWDHALSACWPDLLSWANDRFWPPSDGDPLSFATRMPWSQIVLLANPLRPDNTAFQSWVETSFAIGLVPLAAALCAFFDRDRRALVLFFAAIAGLSFGIATADQPFFALARLVPGLCEGDLRRLLFTTATTLTVLATLGADQQLRSARRRPMILLLATVAAGSAVAIAWAAAAGDDRGFVQATAELIAADRDHPQVAEVNADVTTIANYMQSASHVAEPAHNRAMLTTTAWRALAVAALGIAALWLGARARLAAWLALTIAELLHAGLGPVQTVPAERVTRLPAVLQPVADAAEPNGVRPRLQRFVGPGATALAGLPGNVPGFLGLEDAGAYNPLPPARYEQFFTAIEPARDGKPDVAHGGAGVGAFHDAASLAHPLCDLYGIRFVLTRTGFPTSDTLLDRTPPRTGGYRLLERTTTLPRATLVDQVDVLPDAKERLAALGRADRDVRRRMVLEDEGAPRVEPGAAANGTATIVERRDERVTVRVETAGACWLRLADPYDAGWCASIDGAPARVFVADHYLRAVFVPAGTHDVVFTYDGARVVWPPRLAGAALLVAIALLLFGRRRTA